MFGQLNCTNEAYHVVDSDGNTVTAYEACEVSCPRDDSLSPQTRTCDGLAPPPYLPQFASRRQLQSDWSTCSANSCDEAANIGCPQRPLKGGEYVWASLLFVLKFLFMLAITALVYVVSLGTIIFLKGRNCWSYCPCDPQCTVSQACVHGGGCGGRCYSAGLANIQSGSEMSEAGLILGGAALWVIIIATV